MSKRHPLLVMLVCSGIMPLLWQPELCKTRADEVLPLGREEVQRRSASADVRDIEA